MPELLDHVSQEMIKLYPLIVDLHAASLGNILILAPVISDLMRHPVPPQVARRILRPQDDQFSLPGKRSRQLMMMIAFIVTRGEIM